MTGLGYSPKLKRGMGLAFNAHFWHDFFINIFFIFFLSIDKVSIPYLFPAQDIKQNVLVSFYLDN